MKKYSPDDQRAALDGIRDMVREDNGGHLKGHRKCRETLVRIEQALRQIQRTVFALGQRTSGRQSGASTRYLG